MEVRADLRDVAEGAGQFLRAPRGVAGGEADARDSRHLCHGFKKTRERLCKGGFRGRGGVEDGVALASVVEDALSEKGDLADATGCEAGDFLDDLLRGAAVFGPAGVGNDAVRAAAVAAEKNGDEGGKVGVKMTVGNVVVGNLGGHKALSVTTGRDVGNNGRDEARCAATDGEVERRHLFEDLFAHALGHAAHDPDDASRTFAL